MQVPPDKPPLGQEIPVTSDANDDHEIKKNNDNELAKPEFTGGAFGSPLSHRKTTAQNPDVPEAASVEVVASDLTRDEEKQKITHWLKTVIEFVTPEDARQPAKRTLFFNEEFCRQYKTQFLKLVKGGEFAAMCSQDKTNIYLALLVLQKIMGNEIAANNLIDKLSAVNGEQLTDHLDCVIEYIRMSRTHPNVVSSDAFDHIICLAWKTHFAPAIWLIAKYAIAPGFKIHWTPDQLIELMKHCPGSEVITSLCVIFGMHYEDLALQGAGRLDKHSPNEYTQVLCVFATWLRQPNIKPISIGSQGYSSREFSKLQRMLAGIGATIDCLIRPDVKEQWDETSREERDRIRKEKAANRREMLKSPPGKTSYLQSVSHLIMGMDDMYQLMSSPENPLGCAQSYEMAARQGFFPGLWKAAAQIYMGFGRYHDASRCLNQLLTLSLLSAQQVEAESMLELCELHSNETTSPAKDPERLAQTPLVEASSKKKKKKKKKAATAKMVKAERSDNKKDNTVEEKSPRVDPGATIQPDVDHDSAPDAPSLSDSEKNREDVGVEAVCSPLRGKSAERRFWVSDSNPLVQRFLYEVNLIRNGFEDKYTLKDEKDYLMRWHDKYRKTPMHGRVCEEIGMFYYRQAGLPEWTSIQLIDGDKASDRRTLLDCAKLWAFKSLSFHFKQEMPDSVNNESLNEIISDYYRRNTDLKDNSDFTKRIRSGCSILGHIHGRLALKTYGKARESLRAVAQKYYHLKRVADPHFYKAEPKLPEGKLNVVSDEVFKFQRPY